MRHGFGRIEGLGLDRHPQLLPVYFGNYTRVVYLTQLPDEGLARKAEKAAQRLGLPLVVRHTGLGGLMAFLDPKADRLGSPLLG